MRESYLTRFPFPYYYDFEMELIQTLTDLKSNTSYSVQIGVDILQGGPCYTYIEGPLSDAMIFQTDIKGTCACI